MKCTVTVKYSNRPVITGFVQYQDSSVQLAQNQNDQNAKLTAVSGTIDIHQQRKVHSAITNKSGSIIRNDTNSSWCCNSSIFYFTDQSPTIGSLIHVYFFFRIHVVTLVEVPFSLACFSCCSLLDLIVP